MARSPPPVGQNCRDLRTLSTFGKFRDLFELGTKLGKGAYSEARMPWLDSLTRVYNVLMFFHHPGVRRAESLVQGTSGRQAHSKEKPQVCCSLFQFEQYGAASHVYLFLTYFCCYSDEEIYRLEHEVRIMKRLDHPNIVKFYNLFSEDDYFYIVQVWSDTSAFQEHIYWCG